jgi:rare lipoprotein A
MVIGDPFTIDGKTWTPADTLNSDQVGYAAAGSEGGTGISAAHRTLPLPSYVEVTSLESGKTVLVRLERRGPMRNDRLIELSPGAAAQLGINGDNAPVRVRRVNPPEADRGLLRTGQQAPARMDTPKPLLAVLMRKLTGAPLPQAEPAPLPAASPTPAALAGKPPAPAKPPAKGRRPVAPPPVVTAIPAAVVTSPTPKPAPAATTAAPATHGSLAVQAAAFSTKDRADAAAAKLGARVSPAGRLWRMQLGPFASQAEAQAGLAKARSAGYKDARIVRAD